MPLYTGSRSAWIGLASGFSLLVVCKGLPYRQTAVAMVLGLTVNVFTLAGPSAIEAISQREILSNRQSPFAYVARENWLHDGGVGDRIVTTKRALELWQEAPLVGLGLGSFLWEQREEEGPKSTIHNAALWLLTETAIVGLILFTSFFAVVMVSLSRVSYQSPLILAAMGMLATLAGASIGTEIMYQRYAWFVLGMSLVRKSIPRPTRADAICQPS